ncbi:hypothetical protein [Streptomyces sp. NPDC006879]|uniref:hypothetical protein n=1 Tax=Streptomyces sp. NPDC006879 TaxID=3364767 RepID=UPI0036C5D2C9
MLRVLERADLVADGGRIRVYIGAESEDFRMITNPHEHDSAIMKDLLKFLKALGLEMVNQAEYDEEFDTEDNIITYLCEREPLVAEWL